MNNFQESHVHLIGTSETNNLTESLQKLISQSLSETIDSEIVSYDSFKNWETKVQLKESVRGKHVYVIADPNWQSDDNISFNDKLMQAFLILQTAKKHWAKTINLVICAYPYSRQDQPIHWWNKERVIREPSSTKFIADIIEMLWIDYFINIDIHNRATWMAFDATKFISIYTWWFIEKVRNILSDRKTILVATDEWSVKKIDAISRDLKVNNIKVLKTKDYEWKEWITNIDVFWDVAGKDLLIHDDIIDTWWTLCEVIKELHKQWPKSINIACTHWMFNWEALKKLENIKNMFENIYVTNSIKRKDLPEYIVTIPCDNTIANVIIDIVWGRSINYNNNF